MRNPGHREYGKNTEAINGQRKAGVCREVIIIFRMHMEFWRIIIRH